MQPPAGHQSITPGNAGLALGIATAALFFGLGLCLFNSILGRLQRELKLMRPSALKSHRLSLTIGHFTVGLACVMGIVLILALRANSGALGRDWSQLLLGLAASGTGLAALGLLVGAAGMQQTGLTPRRRNKALAGLLLNFISLAVCAPLVFALLSNARLIIVD